MKLNEVLIAKTRPVADAGNVVAGKNYRITVLTPSLIRVETQKEGVFTDEATQYVWYRDFPRCEFTHRDLGSTVVIETEACRFNFSKLRKRVMSVYLESEKKWVECSNKSNLGGTCRTLDMRLGRVKTGNGVISKSGVAVLYDDGVLLNADGTLGARKAKEADLYIFAYGREYQRAIDAYFYLTGKTPMLPRYVLGNWWSRYYAYTQDEYLGLMDRFERENIPVTVATVDMDWHYVRVNEKFGTHYKSKNPFLPEGWTGYSWNKELFPDYKEFLRKLHEKGYRVTLNLHPADGIRSYEDMYEEVASAMGADAQNKTDIPFDIADNRFINVYFDKVHHPYEDDGVDFWWIDWQQGRKSTLKDVDPLFALNHYHYLDNARGGKRGLVLSRYCGIGAHRYPLGFSGDYISRFASLKFQPEFTNRASNIGYYWWSHDIGGHNFGICDDEMYLRWLQYGVFSPINRLHSSAFALQGKEPWKRSETVKRISAEYMRLRHAMIPYIYTAMRAAHKDNIAVCRPMYYAYPDKKEAYEVPNQYFFGSELIVCPITSRVNARTKLATARVWLPEGRYTDIFTGYSYEGGRTVTVCRDLEHMPVFARAGAIIPMSEDSGNGCENPKNLRISVYVGNGSYTLYEDDGISREYENGRLALTEFTVCEQANTVKFTVKPQGDFSVLPETRNVTVVFEDIVKGELYVNGQRTDFDGTATVTLDRGEGADIVIENAVRRDNGDCFENVNVVFSRFNGVNMIKNLLYSGIKKAKDKEALKKAIKRSLFPESVKIAALEKLL